MPDQPPVPRVGFNAALLSLSADFRSAGIHRYITGLLPALAESGSAEIVAFTGESRARAVLPAPIALRVAPPWIQHRLLRIAWEQVGLPVGLRRAAVDLFHGAAYAIPRFSPVPAVVTVHDLAFFRVPETFPARQGAYLRAATRSAVRRAAAVLAVSEFTRREIVALLGTNPERVHTVPNGLDANCRPLPAATLASFRQRHRLPERYLLTVGTLQPRKNLGTLLSAYAELRRRRPATPALVVAGARGWGDDDPRRQARDLGVGEHVHFPGFLPAEDLPALYGAASVFALPSLYEGFGLPVIEAMACGTPVIIANASSLPEVAGEAALAVDPVDVGGWATALATVLDDAEPAARLVAAGFRQAARFSWARTARETVNVYGGVLADSAPKATRAAARRGRGVSAGLRRGGGAP